MTTPRGVSSSVAVADPGYPDRVIKPNADGSVNVVLGGGPTSPGYVLDGVYTEKGYQQITNLLASTALTVPSGANYALVVCTGQTVRWRADGTDPTASIGMPLLVGQSLWFDASSISVVEFIETTPSAVLNVNYYS